MHFLAKEGTDLGDLPRATIAQTMDLEHGIELGLAVSTGTGAVLGLLVYAFADTSLALGAGTVDPRSRPSRRSRSVRAAR